MNEATATVQKVNIQVRLPIDTAALRSQISPRENVVGSRNLRSRLVSMYCMDILALQRDAEEWYCTR